MVNNEASVIEDGRPINSGLRVYKSEREHSIHTTFRGSDGKEYKIGILMAGEGKDDVVYVNGARMRDWEDKPCEYAGRCMGNNENCSYKGSQLPDGCTFYADRKEEEAQIDEIEAKKAKKE